MSPHFRVILCTLFCGPLLAAEDPLTQFEREVRPLLQERCYECHGPEKQKGGLRLDQRSGFNGGDSEEPAVVPGKSAESALVKRALSTDPEESMPPKGKRLEPQQIAALRQWIDRGAHWPTAREPEPAEPAVKGRVITAEDRAFWAFQPPRRHDAPEAAWARQPLDRFILARLKSGGIQPSPEAPRRVFIRRVTLDLTGLPATPEEVESYLHDANPDADARVVERLLASPRFGERLASLWLPLARFAEDQAHQVGDDTKFFYPNAHLYRAWVISAFNRDLPYDQFVKLQLAADRLPDTAPADLAALGFLGLGPKYYNRNRLEVMADEWEDRVDTVTRTLLGLTVACARCHDHKFDPITTQDYHALAGVFASTRMLNRHPEGRPEKDDTKGEKMHAATLHVVEDGEVQNLPVFIRGNVGRKGAVVARRFLEVLSPAEPTAFAAGSGRRELADAIASADNPLTARVFVNRVWGLFFAQPLVATPSNFGHSGERPADPELLDDLAAHFVENGWSVKALAREIVLSAAYRQSGASRRLSIEQWRDSVLSVAGELTEEPGARSQNLDDPANTRRTIYARISRLKLNDLLMQFDYPDANVHAEARSLTTTPLQRLFVLNSPFIQRRAAALAGRVQGAAESEEERVATIYRLLFAREPDDAERALALDFLRKADASETPRWERYAHLLLASNEMLYVD